MGGLAQLAFKSCRVCFCFGKISTLWGDSLPLLVPLPWRQPAGQSVLNYNYLCMTKGHETCLMTHLPQSRTKRAVAAALTRYTSSEAGSGKRERAREGQLCISRAAC